MNNIFPLIGVLCLAGCATFKNAPQYDFNWSERPDFGELRREMGWADDFVGRCESVRPINEMAEAMNQSLWQKAATQGIDYLLNCPIDIRVHYYTAIAFSELGQESEAENHFDWAFGLLDSIVESGDGETPETAYETISISEEYDAILLFGLEKKSQALVAGPVMCDLITATNKDGKEFSIYFNPAAHFYRLNKLLK